METGERGKRGKNSAMGKKLWTSVRLTMVELGKERKRRWWMAWMAWMACQYDASLGVRLSGRVCLWDSENGGELGVTGEGS